jgi:peptide/nickel transport system substrate-binding protein
MIPIRAITIATVSFIIGSTIEAGNKVLYAAEAVDRIVVAWEAPVRSIDPRYALDANSQYLEDLANCSLMAFTPEGSPQPSLAAEKPAWSDPTTLKVKVRRDAKFSDGTMVTAADVRATYEFFIKPPPGVAPTPRAGAFAKLVSIEALASDLVVFKLQEPDASFISNLVVGILPEKLAKGPTIEAPAAHTGCGPFRIKAIDTGSLTLVRNDAYTIAALPRVASVDIKVVKDEKTRFAKLQKGEVDLVQNLLSRDVLKDIERKYPSLRVIKRPALKTSYLGFNMKDKLGGNLAVRRAIALALDRQEIIDYVLGGLATPAVTMLVPSDPFFNKSLIQDTRNLAKAGEILDNAGFKAEGGRPRFSLSLKTTTDLTRVSVAKAISSQLKKIGINVVVEAMEWGRFAADVDAGRIQMWSLSWVGFKDPDIYRYAFGSESMPPKGGNRGFYSNPDLDKLLNAGREATEPKKRNEIYASIQQLIANEMPYVFLWHEENFAVHRESLKGFDLFADGRYSALAKAYKSVP